MADPVGELRHTALYALHRELGARMVPFAGYALPIQYPAGILAEHRSVRERAGLFDVSHMGQIEVSGPGVFRLLDRACPLDAARIPDGHCCYTMLLSETAGILDDLIVTRLGPERFLLVVNAANTAADLAHLRALGGEVDLHHLPRALLAVQGPEAQRIVVSALPGAAELGRMQGMDLEGGGFVSRTGYTGEDGFEIGVCGAKALALARLLLADDALSPTGLGARDSLRLEAGLCLHGQDITPGITPLEAGLMWTIPAAVRERGAFLGSGALADAMACGARRKRVGLLPLGRAPVRAETPLLSPNGVEIGSVTSGGYAPSLEVPVAMGYVASEFAVADTEVYAEVRGRSLPCSVAALPFVRRRRTD